MGLVIDVPGVFLSKHGERIVAKKGGALIGETPLDELESVVVEGRGISFSSDLIEALATRGIPLDFISPRGEAFATLLLPVQNGTVLTRREQLRAFDDERGFSIARSIVGAKLQSQANLLKYFAKYRRTTEPDAYALIVAEASEIEKRRSDVLAVKAKTVDEARTSLMNCEGRAGASYWKAVSLIFGERHQFVGREHRDAVNPINQALNYGYAILYGSVQRALIQAGLDPFGGFLHVDRPGKPSLVLDCMEEFRQSVVDRPLFGRLNRGFELQSEEDRLDRDSRRAVVDLIEERLEARGPIERGEQWTLRAMIGRQARRMATAVRGERSYEPYALKW